MIKHMVLFAFKDEVDDEQQQAILDELNQLPTRYPAMQNWSCGRNISNRRTTLTMTHAFVVEFEQEKDLLDYLHSHGHEEFVANRWRQAVVHQVIVSYEYN